MTKGLLLISLLLMSGCEMRNQFELEAEADPHKLIAISHYGTTPTSTQGETGFRVYLRNSSPKEIKSITFHVRAYGEDGSLIGNSTESSSKPLHFNQRLDAGEGAHPLWPDVWSQGKHSSNIACADIESADITYTDGTMAIIPKQALDSMTYNPKCLSLDGAQFEFRAN